MVSDRALHTRGFGALIAAASLVAAGGALVQAFDHGFYGTVALAALIAVWLAALLWWGARHPRFAAAMSTAPEDGEDERIMLRVLLDQAPGALIAVEGMRVRVLNRAARMLFATDDFVLPAPPELLSPDAARLRHGGRGWRLDRVVVAGGGTDRVLVALVDIEAAEHAAEARATRDLLRVMGHEVMNAMAPITSLAESALAVISQPEQRDRLLPEILATLARRTDGLRRFTDAYRQVARLPEPTLGQVKVAEIFADLARLFDAEWQNAVTLVAADPDDIMGKFDRDQMVQALLALLRNAGEATPADTIPKVVRLTARATPYRLTFEVTDTGPGIDPMDRSAIFLPFYTTKPDGNGIGLTAARQIAQAHGGDILLIPGIPTTFELSIPQEAYQGRAGHHRSTIPTEDR